MFNYEILTALAVAPLMLAAMSGVGGRLLLLCKTAETENEAVRLFPISVALGFSVYSYLGYLFALATPFSPWLILTLFALGVALGWSYFRLLVKGAQEPAQQLLRSLKSPLVLLFAVLTAMVLSLALMSWLTPPREGDALWGYMFTARWLYSNGLNFIPYNPRYSLFPFNTELVYSFSFAFGTDLIAKLLDGLLGLCFLIGLYELARRCGTSRLFSFFVAATVAVLPNFFRNWSNGKVDVASCFIFFAAVSLLLWRSERVTNDFPNATFALAALLFGTACSQKYTFWIFTAATPICLFFIFKNRGKVQTVRAVGLFVLIVALSLAPHLIKNFVWAGNPIAPFAEKTFGSTVQTVPHASDSTEFSLRDLPFLPAKLFFGFEEGTFNRGNSAFPLLILFGLPLFFLIKNKPPLVKAILLAALLQLAVWIVARQNEWLNGRFVLVQIALLLIVAAYSLDYFARRSSLLKTLVVLLTIFIVSFDGVWANRSKRESLAFIIGRESRADWQQRMAAGRAYSVLHKISSRLEPEARVMAMSSLYNIPEDKIKYAATEFDYIKFLETPDERKAEYLKVNKFKFYLWEDDGAPPWADQFKIIDQNRAGLPWTMYEIE